MRVVVMIAYRPALPFFPDAQAYRAIAKSLTPDPVRPMAYPLFLRVLSPFRSLAVAAGVQHLMILLVAVGLYALLRRRGIGAAVAIVGVCPVLFDAYQLNVEHSIMAEALFESLIVAALLLILWRERPSLVASIGAGLALGAASLTRTAGIPLIFVFVFYALVRRFGVKRVAALLLAFATPLVAYGFWYRSARGTFALESFDGYWLYGRVAPFADCTGVQLPQNERVLCEATPPALRTGADFYTWDKKSPTHRLAMNDGPKKNAVLADFARRIIFHQPAAYLAAIGGDMLHYFAPGRWRGPRDGLVISWQFQNSNETYIAATAGSYPPPPDERVTVVRPLADALIAYQRVVYTWGPLLLFGIVVGLAGSLGGAAGLARLRADAFLFTISGFTLLFVTTLSTAFGYRYTLPANMLVGPGAALGGSMLLQRLKATRSL